MTVHLLTQKHNLHGILKDSSDDCIQGTLYLFYSTPFLLETGLMIVFYSTLLTKMENNMRPRRRPYFTENTNSMAVFNNQQNTNQQKKCQDCLKATISIVMVHWN